MRSKLTTVARLLFGVLFFVFGLNGFVPLIPLPPTPPQAGPFLEGLGTASYFYPLLQIVQIVAGLALLANRFVPLALVMLAPVIVHITAFHLVLAPSLPEAIGVPGIELWLVWSYRDAFRDLLRPRHLTSAS